MPIYRTLKDFGKLLPAEAEVLARMAEDEPVVIDPTAKIDGSVSALRVEAHKIRAEFVAFLARGGGEGAEPPPHGLYIQGAWIAGVLHLRGPAIDRDLGLYACRFDAPPNLRSARLANLYLNGAHLPGLNGDRLEAKGGVFLRQAVVEGEARFLGARLGGDLDCLGARFSSKDGPALSADGLKAAGAIFLRHAKVKGQARFHGVRLGGVFDCMDALFLRKDGIALNANRLQTVGTVFLLNMAVEGETRFHSAQVGGNLECNGARFENAGKVALHLDGARVDGALFLRNDVQLRGRLDMTDASFGNINDDRASWPGPGDLILNRCRYEAFTGGPVDARSRLDWLALQDPARVGQDFWPQPYEQLAKVFREMGHAADARAVLIEKERLQRRAERETMRAVLRGAAMRRRIERAGAEELPALAHEVDALVGEYAEGRPNQDRVVDQIEKARPLRAGRIRSRPEAADEAMARIDAVRARLATGPLDPLIAARSVPAALSLKLAGRVVWDHLVGAVVGYGRRPQQAFLWLLFFWAVGAVVFGAAAGRDAVKPNNAFILRAPEWALCAYPEVEKQALPTGVAATGDGRRAPGERQLDCFQRQPEALRYPDFNAALYSLDTLLPVVEMEMQDFWIPDEDQAEGLPWYERIGRWARLYLWVHIFLGWALSLLAVAGFSGLVKSD